MKIKNEFKRFTTILLTAALVVAYAMPVLATEVGQGTSTITQTPKDIINVTVPTNEVWNFYIDPAKLLNKTASADYAAKTVLFKQADDKYDDMSKPFAVKNESTVPINLLLTGKIENVGGDKQAGVSENINTVESQTTPQVAIVIGECTVSDNKAEALTGTPVHFTTAGATISKNMAALDEDEFEIKEDTAASTTELKKFKYEPKASASANVTPHWFALKGAAAASPGADWSGITTVPKISVVYKIMKGTEDVTPLPEKDCTLTLSTGTTITASNFDASAAILIKVGSDYLTNPNSDIGVVKINDSDVTLAASGTSSTIANALYFKLPAETVISAGDKIEIVIAGTKYKYTF